MITNECVDSVNETTCSTNFDVELPNACGSSEAFVDGRRPQKRQFPVVAEERMPQKKEISPLKLDDQQTMIAPDSIPSSPRVGGENAKCSAEVNSDCKKTPQKSGNPPPPYNQPDFLSAPNQHRYLSRLSHISASASDQEYFYVGLRRKLNFNDF